MIKGSSGYFGGRLSMRLRVGCGFLSLLTFWIWGKIDKLRIRLGTLRADGSCSVRRYFSSVSGPTIPRRPAKTHSCISNIRYPQKWPGRIEPPNNGDFTPTSTGWSLNLYFFGASGPSPNLLRSFWEVLAIIDVLPMILVCFWYSRQIRIKSQF